jgi:hypothetical protein
VTIRHVPLDEVPRILSEGMTEVKSDDGMTGGYFLPNERSLRTTVYIFWVFQWPRLNRMALATAIEPSATTMDQNTPLERKPK